MDYQIWTYCQRPGEPFLEPTQMATATDLHQAVERARDWSCGGLCSRNHQIVEKVQEPDKP